MNVAPKSAPAATTVFPTGIVVLCGYWEPLAYLRRRGAASVDDEQRYRAAHSEAMAEALVARGVNAVIWHGYKGLGLEFEKGDIELTAQFGRHCRKHGIILGAYCNLGSFYAETMLLENPEAAQWPALDAFGVQQPYSEFYRHTYRWRPCMTHESFVDYVQRAALLLIRDAGAQWIHFDNNAAVPSYTERFLSHFRRRLAEKYQTQTPEGRQRFRRRYGFDTPEGVVLPRGSARMPIDTVPAAQDPNLQEWIEYRCELLTRAYHRITDAIKAADPATVVTLNPPMHRGEFIPMLWGVDIEALAGRGDCMFAEDGLEPRLEPGGQLVGNFPNYKFGQAANQRILTHQSGKRLDLFEAAVHNRGCVGRVFWADQLPPLDAESVRIIQFLRRHESLFAGTQSLADVAVLRGRTAMVNNWAQTFQSSLMVWQTLARYGIQWDMILERSLAETERLGRYRLLILPNTISLPDDAMKQIATYVESGGRVLAIEQSGQCDGWGRSRAGAVEGLDAEYDDGLGLYRPAQVAQLGNLLGLSETARRRVFHLPELPSPHPWKWDPHSSRVSSIGVDHWCLPRNADRLVAAVRSALGDQMLLCREQPSYIVPQLVRGRDGQTYLHLLDYSVSQPADGGVIQLGFPVKRAAAFSMEEDRWQDVPLERNGREMRLHYRPFAVWQTFRLDGCEFPWTQQRS